MRKCKNDPDRFCYVSGKVTLPDRQASITSFVKKCYHPYFGMKLSDQDKSFVPYIYCKTCGKLEKMEQRKDEEASVWCANGVERGWRSRDRLLFVHDKLARFVLRYVLFVKAEVL